MSLLRPLDPAFPIERQIALEAVGIRGEALDLSILGRRFPHLFQKVAVPGICVA
jgi:hypothetical protein